MSIFLIFFFSCEKIKSEKEIISVIDSTQIDFAKINHSITKLSPKAKIMVENWGEYQKIDEFIQQYRNISFSNALLNAKELSELSKQLRDSIRVEKLKVSSVKIRLNVLHNETLRLADMATINYITNSEVIHENKNIIEAYSALNMKINNIITQEKLNDDVNEFIEEIINSDSIISRKMIKPDSLKLNKIQL
ncbi:MAG: hypothetical protein GQ552_04400 [Flavobacteriaceae bacterium]|nr:hypothetical protein [Flavobacteriaceae bacterium]